jgi:RNA polymerase sigma-70 factor (ECF subfamily)
MPMFRETEEFSIFSIMSDDSLSIENKIISEQVEIDIKRLIEELPVDQKEVLVMRMNMRKVIDKHQIVLTN